MKHFRYTHLEDYLEKANAYPDPKTVKIVSLRDTTVYAVVNLHSSCIDYRLEFDSIESAQKAVGSLKSTGHKEGTVIETAPLRF